jgi:3-hydroxyacyl-[acyl-carrier-protein] dehydratase
MDEDQGMTGKLSSAVRETGHDSWEGIFYFHPDDPIYRDHFPGYPVVPGSVIVYAFLLAAEENGFISDNLSIENFRFREFLIPGHYPYCVEIHDDRLNCFIYRDTRKLVTGVLKR